MFVDDATGLFHGRAHHDGSSQYPKSLAVISKGTHKAVLRYDKVTNNLDLWLDGVFQESKTQPNALTMAVGGKLYIGTSATLAGHANVSSGNYEIYSEA